MQPQTSGGLKLGSAAVKSLGPSYGPFSLRGSRTRCEMEVFTTIQAQLLSTFSQTHYIYFGSFLASSVSSQMPPLPTSPSPKARPTCAPCSAEGAVSLLVLCSNLLQFDLAWFFLPFKSYSLTNPSPPPDFESYLCNLRKTASLNYLSAIVAPILLVSAKYYKQQKAKGKGWGTVNVKFEGKNSPHSCVWISGLRKLLRFFFFFGLDFSGFFLINSIFEYFEIY